MVLNGLRNGLGNLIALIDRLTQPTPMQRTPARQAAVEKELQNLAIYQFARCPYCIKTRRAMRRLNLPIVLRDAKISPWREELRKGGGKIQTPCLRIGSGANPEWMYESSDIIRYLASRFGQQ